MNKVLINYFKKKIHNIEEMINQNNRAFNLEKYHHLRVEIKKLKLILNIIDASGIQFKNNKYLNQLMRLFKQAGKIRALDLLFVYLKTFKKIKKSTPLQLELNKELKKEKQLFFKMKTNPIDYKKIKKIVSKKIKKIDSIEAYSKTLKNEIKKDIKIWEKYNSKNRDKKSIKVSKLHQTRIHLKYWINYLKLFKQDLPEKYFLAMKNLALKLGEWHDHVEFKKQLFQFLQNTSIQKGSIQDVLLIILKNQQKIELLEIEINKKIKAIDLVDD